MARWRPRCSGWPGTNGAVGGQTRPLENKDSLDEYHASPWIGVKDIGNGLYTLTVAEVVEAEMQDMKTGHLMTKDTLVFAEPKIKCALPLNDTNFNVMRNAYGPVPRDWIGKRVEIYVDWSTRNPNSGEPGGVRIKALDAPEVVAPTPTASITRRPSGSHNAPLKDVTPAATTSPQAGNAYAAASQPAIVQPSGSDISASAALDDEIPF